MPLAHAAAPSPDIEFGCGASANRYFPPPVKNEKKELTAYAKASAYFA
jgi:hypothetical protein